jgi:tripartite ATP-independent transporter DctM subunit
MNIEFTTFLLIGLLLIFLFMGLPLAFVLGGLAALFTLFLWGPHALYNIVLGTYSGMTNFVMIAVPMFIFMASVLQRSGIAEDLYKSMHLWLGPLKGGLAIGTVVICTIFAAMAGISAAATVSMGLIALPSMFRYGYDKNIVIGCISAGGALGILIPPSVTMVILGLFANLSVGKLFLGGVFSGILLSCLFILYIIIRCFFQPHIGPPIPQEERGTWKQKFASLKSLILPIIIITGVLGSIFSGVATPTEGAGVGCTGTILCAIVRGKLNRQMLQEACQESLRLSCMIMWIIFGAICFVAVYQAIGAQSLVAEIFKTAPGGRWGVLLLMQFILLIMGAFIDPNGIIMITTPIFFPVITSLGFDPLWFGVLFIVNMEMGFLTPPFGYNLFYMRAIAPKGVTLGDIYKSIIPFVLLQAIGLILCMIFPEIILWLPNKVLGVGGS